MKVVLTGPESVGKSTLVKQLAQRYKGVYIEEYARKYVEDLSEPYTFRDVENIVKKQLEEYDDHKAYEGFCFFDTYLIISKIWFLHVFGYLPNWFEKEFKKRPVDLYLLCKDDIKWESDGVRENKDLRGTLFSKYQKQLDEYGFCYAIIEGKGDERLKNTIDAIEEKIINNNI